MRTHIQIRKSFKDAADGGSKINLLVRIALKDGGRHKSFEHSNKGCVWNEDAPTVAFVRLFSAIGACGHLQPQALFVSLRTTRTERT